MAFMYNACPSDLPCLVLDAEIHRPGVEIDAAVALVLVGEISHWGSPLFESG
jgi:hypothetical protein